jgi:hypothetical protein
MFIFYFFYLELIKHENVSGQGHWIPDVRQIARTPPSSTILDAPGQRQQ